MSESHDVIIVQPPNDIAHVVCDGPDVPLGDPSILMMRGAYLVFKLWRTEMGKRNVMPYLHYGYTL
jgi:hypothetical protein